MPVAAHLPELVKKLGLLLFVQLTFAGYNCFACQPVGRPASARATAEPASQNRNNAASIETNNNSLSSVDDDPDVAVKHVSTYYMKPPAKDLRFDVTLRNKRSSGRWFLLPHAVAQDNWLRPVKRLERTRLHGKRGVLLIGRSYLDFNAVFIPPGGVVTIRNLHTDIFARALPAVVSYQVVIASEVLLGPEPLTTWFGQNPTALPNVDVEDDRWQIGQDDLGVRESPTSTDEGSREWTIHVRARHNGNVEVSEVTAAHWIESGRSDMACERRHRDCFETVLSEIRLKKVPAAGASFDWVLSVSRTEDND
jgi:hypothetical protein